MKRLLSLFDESGVFTRPFAEAGWEVITWDLKNGRNVKELNSGESLTEIFPFDIDGVMAFPPCTDFAVSGARHWAKKDKPVQTLFGEVDTVEESRELIRQVLRIADWFYPTDPDYDGTFFWAMENPVGRLKKFFPQIGDPYYFQPYEFAGWLDPDAETLKELDRIRKKDGKNITKKEWELIIETNAYTKKTGLWGSFNSNLKKKPIEPVKGSPFGSAMMRMGGKGCATKENRSKTPEGFARAFFAANHNWRPEDWDQGAFYLHGEKKKNTPTIPTKPTMKLPTFALNGLSGLAMPSVEVQNIVADNDDNVKAIIKMLESESDNFKSEIFTFDDNDELYNRGITTGQKKAWVFYKRKYEKIPMTGWEKYWIDLEDQAAIDELVMQGDLLYMGGDYMPEPVYTFGNLYEREEQLKADKDYLLATYSVQVYENQQQVIEQARPRAFRLDDPEEERRPYISPTGTLAKTFKIKEVRQEWMNVEDAALVHKDGKKTITKNKRINIDFSGEKDNSLQDVFVKWIYTIDRKRYFEGSEPYDVAFYFIKGFPITDKNDSGNKLSAGERKEIFMKAQENGERLFQIFLNRVITEDDQRELERVFNKKYNGWGKLNTTGIPIGLENSASFLGGGFAIRPEKREAITYMEAVGSGILAYDVGVGKTVSSLLEIASAIFSGKCKRALIVVPDPTYKNWRKEAFGAIDPETGEKFDGILSNLGLNFNDWANLGVDKIDEIGEETLEMRVQDRSVTILTYHGFKQLGFSEKVSEDFLEELRDALNQANLDPELESEGYDARQTGSKRSESKSNEKIEEVIGRSNAETLADFDTLGFDYIVIDEAHRCKNIFEGVKADEDGNKNYDLQGSVSTTGLKAFFICNYIQRTYGRNVMLLTATPFTNSPLEIYSMLTLVGYDLLKEYGYWNINDFFKQFVQPVPEYVVKQGGTIQVKETIKAFRNRIILQNLIFTKVNYKTGDDVGVKRPCKIKLPLLSKKIDGETVKLEPKDQIHTYLQMTDWQRRNQDDIIHRMKAATKGRLDKSMLFKAMGESLGNALSPYLYKDPDTQPPTPEEFVETSPKLMFTMLCIKSVREWHNKRNEPMSGQVMYADRGKDYFPLIKKYMNEYLGFKTQVPFEEYTVDEVMMIGGGKAKEKVDRDIIMQAFNAGVIKVIIGTSAIKEGVNLQKRSTCLYNLYPNWNPTDVQQLDGRVHRQGNRFGFVRLAMPLVENSMDVFVLQKLEEKTARINDIFFREGSSNVLDLNDLDPGEMKYALISDIHEIAKVEFFVEMDKLADQSDLLRDDNTALSEVSSLLKRRSMLEQNLLEYLRLPNTRANITGFMDELKDRLENLKAIKNKTGRDQEDFEDVKWKLSHAKDVLKRFDQILDNPTSASLYEADWTFNKWNNFVGAPYMYRIEKAYLARNYNDVVIPLRNKETEILKPRGYSLEDDIEKIGAEIQNEYAKSQALFEEQFYSKSFDEDSGKPVRTGRPFFEGFDGNREDYALLPDRYQEIYQEILDKKERLNVKGESPEYRAKQFSSLNYLMSYGIKDVDVEECDFPEGPAGSKPAPKPKSNLKLLKLKAKALKLKLELMEL